MFCPQCGHQKADGMAACDACGYVDAPTWTSSSSSISDDPTMRLILPVGQSLYAIAAGYLGLCSVIFLPAPFAIIFGWLALRDIKKNPKLGGKGRAIFGLVMGIIFTLIPAGFIVAAIIHDMTR